MNKSPEQAVTVLISRRVKSGHEAEFERLSRQLMAVAADFKGYLGAQLVQPSEEPGSEDGLYHVVLAFESHESLDLWQGSPARSLGLTALAPHIEGVHLRFGPVARGGLRWSDRRDDFRTEVLGLVKILHQVVCKAIQVHTLCEEGLPSL